MKSVLFAGAAALLVSSGALAQVSIVNNIPGTFIDISGSGAPLGLNGADDSAAPFNAAHGNSILAAGTIFASSNGYVSNIPFSNFGNTSLDGFSPAGYAVFWDDLQFFQDGAGEVFGQNFADRTIIQWNNAGGFLNSPSFATFQIQIFSDPTIAAQFIYADINFGDGRTNGGSATIGAIQSGDTPRNFAQWSLNTESITSGSVLTVVVPSPSAAALMGLGGLVAMRRRRA